MCIAREGHTPGQSCTGAGGRAGSHVECGNLAGQRAVWLRQRVPPPLCLRCMHGHGRCWAGSEHERHADRMHAPRHGALAAVDELVEGSAVGQPILLQVVQLQRCIPPAAPGHWGLMNRGRGVAVWRTAEAAGKRFPPSPPAPDDVAAAAVAACAALLKRGCDIRGVSDRGGQQDGGCSRRRAGPGPSRSSRRLARAASAAPQRRRRSHSGGSPWLAHRPAPHRALCYHGGAAHWGRGEGTG